MADALLASPALPFLCTVARTCSAIDQTAQHHHDKIPVSCTTGTLDMQLSVKQKFVFFNNGLKHWQQ